MLSHSLTSPTLKEGHRWRGLRVGLLGGSFNPAHAGHLHIARLAMAKFGLDFVWWIVTPQNPLKEAKGMRPYKERYAFLEKMLQPYPRQMPTHLEAELGTTYTHETVTALKTAFPHTDFIWICGMDNAHIFHQWDHWQSLLEALPVTFIARPPARYLVKGCAVRQLKTIPHYRKGFGRNTDLKTPGIYWLSASKMLDISSTKIRNNK